MQSVHQYLPILVFICLASIIAIALVLIPSFFAPKKPDRKKLSTYECGFDPKGDTRGTFNISFYLTAMLFIIFDLEITFLIPWAITLKETRLPGLLSMLVFLVVLAIGLIYEWRKGALEWE
ncbi:NADH-quinone oxidoreductase subunit A [Rickettsiales bacterium]|nr:NADH-quinone oxidoreductase subunit A [Rickettsiales bacterium]